MDKMKTAVIGNAILWVAAVIAAAVLGRDSGQALLLIIIPVILGAVSIYLVAEAARER